MKIPDLAEIFPELHAISTLAVFSRNFHTSRGRHSSLARILDTVPFIAFSRFCLSGRKWRCAGVRRPALAVCIWMLWTVLYCPISPLGHRSSRSLRNKDQQAFFDVQLMMKTPPGMRLLRGGADLLVIHAEADRHPQRTLSLIRSMGCKAGATPVPPNRCQYTPLAGSGWILCCLWGGSIRVFRPKILPASFAKIRSARDMLDAHGGEVLCPYRWMGAPAQIQRPSW